MWNWKTFKLALGHIFRKIKQTPANLQLFLTIKAVDKDRKAKENFADNHFPNILRLLDVLPNFSFHHKWNEVELLVMVYTKCLTSCQMT